MDDASRSMFTGGMMTFWIIFGLVVYIWMAICLQKIAEKTNTPNGWLAWIPIANIYLMCMIAGKGMVVAAALPYPLCQYRHYCNTLVEDR